MELTMTSHSDAAYQEQPQGNGVYRTDNGRRRRSLIIDPGAAISLLGAAMLRDMLENVGKAKQVNDMPVWRPRQSEVSGMIGISGSADTAWARSPCHALQRRHDRW